MAGREQLAERLHQLRDVVEVQPGGRLVEHEQLRPRNARFRDDPAPIDGRRRFGEEAGQLQPLRFAARQRRHRLAELHVFEADVDDRLQHAQHLGVGREERGRFTGEVEHVGDAQRAAVALDAHFENLGAVAAAVAIRAAQVDVAQELHLDVLEARATAGRAPAVAQEAERAGAIAALQRERRSRTADLVKRADVARRVRPRGLADRRLVDEHDVAAAGRRPWYAPGDSVALPWCRAIAG